MTRNELAILLEGEALNAAAEDVRSGGNPAAICARAINIGPRYDDDLSRSAIAIFHDVAEGRETIID